MSEFHIKAISLRTFNDVLSQYPSTVPEKLQELDILRYASIPAQVVSRQNAAFLSKSEVEKLVEWKLKHGTFRPTLLSLVQSNSSESIIETTKKAFALISTSNLSPLPALKILTGLKGIGPATASLLLSVMRPAVIPFFSDELFRWCCWDESGVSDGWERKIKYNVKEYEQLVGRVEEIVERLQVRAVDVEKVAWVLGRAGADMDIGGKEEEAEQAKSKDDGGFKDKKLVNEKPDKETAKKQSEDAKEIVFEQASTKRTKRKARASISPVEGVRKSTRLKK